MTWPPPGMPGRAAPRLRSRPGRAGWDARAVVLGLLIAGGLSVADASSSRESIVISTVVLAPFVASMLSGPVETAIVAVVAVALALLSATWHHNFDTGAYHVRWAVVAVGGVVSFLVARARERTEQDRERFELLAAVAEVADGRLTLEETA